jgi:hypothetical protein
MRALIIGLVAAIFAWGVASTSLADISVTIGTETDSVPTSVQPNYVNVPVNISLTDSLAVPNATLESLTLEISYNPAVLSLTANNVTAGSIGWTPYVNIPSPGTLIVTEAPAGYVSAPLTKSIFNMNFQVAQNFSGFTPVTFITPIQTSQQLYDYYGNNIVVTEPLTTSFNNGGINAVPELWSLAIMGLVLPGLFWYGWRVSRTQKVAA